MLEYEKKIMLTADEYQAIVKLLCKDLPIKTQTNYYFDTDNLDMNSNGITCRIREKDGRYKATIKSHCAERPDCSVEEDLSEKTDFYPSSFTGFGLRYQGELVTDRIVVQKDSDCELVIDRNTYLGYEDFELEIEYREESEYMAQELLKRIAEILIAVNLLNDSQAFIDRAKQSKSKSHRFFEGKAERR